MKNRMLTAATLIAGALFGFGLMGTPRPALADDACRPNGAECKVMDGANPEPDNNLCCSQHCDWSNGDQKYECD